MKDIPFHGHLTCGQLNHQTVTCLTSRCGVYIYIYTAGQKFPDTWILFNFLIKTPIIISKKFLYHIYFIKDTYSYYLRKKKKKKEKKKNTNNTIIIKLSFRQKITHEFLSLFLRSVASYLLIYLLFRV